jgi:histone H3/H4
MSLPVAPVERLIKEAGISRISITATKAIIDDAENYIKDRAAKAYVLTQHAGRNTLRVEDVQASLNL